jgi:hypothetical protein
MPSSPTPSQTSQASVTKAFANAKMTPLGSVSNPAPSTSASFISLPHPKSRAEHIRTGT